MKAVRPVLASNRVPCLQMRSVGSHSTLERENEGNMERAGWGIAKQLPFFAREIYVSVIQVSMPCDCIVYFTVIWQFDSLWDVLDGHVM